jgi:hypothetical protein
MSPVNPGRNRARHLILLLVFASFAVSTACGGGGGGGGGSSNPLTASFASSNPNPVAGDVSLQAVSASAASFSVDVSFTDMNDVFAATLTMTYDPTAIRFDSHSFVNTFMTAGPTGGPTLLVSDDGAGTVRIAASRLAPDAGVDVAGTRALVRLGFTARRAVANSPIAFAGNLEVCNSQPNGDAVCDLNGAILVNSFTGGAMNASN